MLDTVEAALDAAYDVLRLFAAADAERLAASLPQIRSVVTGGGTGLAPDLMARLPSLGLVAINGVGTDKVDLAAAARAGIHVTTTPGVLTGDVADMALGLLIGVLRRIGQGDRLVRAGQWGRGAPPALGRRLAGRRVGILGLGQIGRAVARRLDAFDARIAYWNRSPLEVPAHWEREQSPHALASACDALIVTLAAGAATDGMVDAAILNALGPEGILINVARGSVVDEDALIEALSSGRIGGAGLDVFRNEPAIDRRFAGLDTVLLAPHQGSATLETRQDMGRIVIDNLAAFYAGRLPPQSVTAQLMTGGVSA
ncbi:2-hydroxyacid dehydrogenase [Aureimonas frigidaquae]